VLEDFLGLTEKKEAALVGVGNLGKALSSFPGFQQYGVEISLLLDNDPEKWGSAAGDHIIYSMAEADARIREKRIKIAIITTPAEVAQEVADLLVEAGIAAIWNFTPVRLTVPEEVYVLYEDLSAGIAILSCKATAH
jgi:redox-sensing transcriptional repressor